MSIGKRILVVDDDDTSRRTLDRFLTRLGYEVTTASSGEEAMLAVVTDIPDIVITDIYMPGMSGLELQAKITERTPHIKVILITGKDDMTTIVKAMQQGAFDYVVKPIDLDLLQRTLSKLVATQALSDKLAIVLEESVDSYKLENILVGRTPSMLEIYKTIGSISHSKVTVLITGESGTGKELIVRSIHHNSPWKDEPFIAVNCTALSETLLESELFGHTKGSFTGAVADKRGKFEMAGEGTIFLDEIGEISPKLQVMLLRVLQEREFERVGGEKTLPMRARVIAATNRDLSKEVSNGTFREDLYYRLNVVSIHVPPLRERKDDIALIVEHILMRINRELHTKVNKVSEEAMEKIYRYDWPGNVRELENVLTQGVVLSKSDILDESVLPHPTSVHPSTLSSWRRTLEEVENEHILRVLDGTGGNRTEAARILGISKPTLYSKIKSTTRTIDND